MAEDEESNEEGMNSPNNNLENLEISENDNSGVYIFKIKT